MLSSIRSRILLFAVLVTLLPSFGLGWLYFKQTEKALLDSTEQQMRGTVAHVERELDLWFKERYYEIRVFSNSYLVSESLENYLVATARESGRKAANAAALSEKLASYLAIVHAQFEHYRRLVVFDLGGTPLAQDAEQTYPAELPDDWQDQLDRRKIIVSGVSDSDRQAPSVTIAVPILSSTGGTLGLLAAEIELNALSDLLSSFLAGDGLRPDTTQLLLVGDQGRILASTMPHDNAQDAARLPQQLFPASHVLREYTNRHGDDVLGILAPVPELSWAVVMERQQDQLLAPVVRLRNRTMFGIAMLASIIGFVAYLVARGIVTPLERLTEAASRVADGDLDVAIPVARHDELGTTTQVFNDMVSQLRHSRARLEQLSTTDALTQLANRKHVLEKLATHLERFRRYGTPFSILLIDADHFKRINDELGHVAGDRVLRRLGVILRRMLRSVDIAGRYGGEEFLVILDETRIGEALQTAERIRNAIASSKVRVGDSAVGFSVSIGVAEIGNGENEDQLIVRADAALYQAKQQGRNRSQLAEPGNTIAARHLTIRHFDRP